MKDAQILAIVLASAPTMLAVLLGILVNNSRLSDLRAYMDGRFGDVNARFTSLERRLDELKEIWRSELQRVEELRDARLNTWKSDMRCEWAERWLSETPPVP